MTIKHFIRGNIICLIIIKNNMLDDQNLEKKRQSKTHLFSIYVILFKFEYYNINICNYYENLSFRF